MNADVVAVHIVGRMLFDGGIESEIQSARCSSSEKTLGSPSMPQEKKLQPCALAMLAQNLGVTEQFGNSLDHRQNLIPPDKRVQPRSEIGFGREPAGNAQGKPISGLPPRVRVIAVRPMSLISG